MRGWSEAQQRQLDELAAIRKRAHDRLQEDVSHVANDQDYDDYHRSVITCFLMAHGQAVLDMLLVHFTPSPAAMAVGVAGTGSPFCAPHDHVYGSSGMCIARGCVATKLEGS
jgi:hypothetical protein